MPEETHGDDPSRNSDDEPLPQHPGINLPQQGIMTEDSTGKASQRKNDAENLAGEVHWIYHATFWSQLGLAVIGLAAVWIYYNQLQQMITVTKATQDAAFDACMSAKIARQTLIEYQSGEVDSHNASSATVAQVAVTTRGESPIIATSVAVAASLPPNVTQSTTPRMMSQRRVPIQ